MLQTSPRENLPTSTLVLNLLSNTPDLLQQVHLMIHRDDTLAGELFDLSLPLRLPIADIRRREGAEGSSRPDRRFDRAVKVRADDTVRIWSLMAGEWEKKRG